MTLVSRRAFTRMIAAGLPLVSTLRLTASRGALVTGVATTSFRDLPRIEGRDNVADVLQLLRRVGAAHADFSLSHVEPAPPNTASFIGGSAAYPRRITLTPEQVASTNASAREALRDWRLRAGLAPFETARRLASDAGIVLDAASVTWNESFTDDEVAVVCRQARALGVRVIRGPMSLAMLDRVLPCAEAEDLVLAIHTQADGGASIGAQAFDAALARSPRVRLALDLGNLTAGGCDAVAIFDQYRSRVAEVIVKDRLQRNGASQPFGDGDTPIAGVLQRMSAADPAIPVFVEYDYVGLRPVADEVATALTYVREIAARTSSSAR